MTAGRWDAWQALSLSPDVTLAYEGPGPGLLGRVDFKSRTITLHPYLLQRERSPLTHELVHLERGPAVAGGEAREERVVDAETAQRLVTIGDLAQAVKWTDDLHELAVELWVDVRTVLTRVLQLAEGERDHLRRLSADRDGGPAEGVA